MQHLGRRYVRYVNDVYRRTVTLWEGRFKSEIEQALGGRQVRRSVEGRRIQLRSQLGKRGGRS